MRNYEHIDQYLDILARDIYNQPSDPGHNAMLADAMKDWEHHFRTIHSILDVGCGEDLIAYPYFQRFGNDYTAIDNAEQNQVIQMDINFMGFLDNAFDGIFARHVLEHSPMPLLTLMEFHRVSNHYLFLILPNPNHYGYIGRNHYSVMGKQQARWLLRRAGWRVIEKEHTTEEIRYVCEKKILIGSEGYAPEPLPNPIYTEDRDDTIMDYKEIE